MIHTHIQGTFVRVYDVSLQVHDETRCCRWVMSSRFGREVQCKRKATTWQTSDDGEYTLGFCHQHDPTTPAPVRATKKERQLRGALAGVSDEHLLQEAKRRGLL